MIDANRICVRVDKEYVDKISTIMSSMNDKTVVKDTIILNIRDCRFAISSIEWKEVSDLIGVHIKINATYRRYDFWKTRDNISENSNESVRVTVKYRGVTILAKKIENIT